MLKRKRKEKTRLKLNETLNRQLDMIQDDVAIDVFKPKEDESMVFMDLVNSAMMDEEMEEREVNKKVDIRDVHFLLGKFAIVCLTSILVLCFLYFMYWTWTLLF